MRRGDDVSNRDGKPPSRRRGARPRIDWDQAFAYFCSASTITFREVGRRFSVSGTAVSKHARTDRWDERRAQLLDVAATKANRANVQSQAQRIQQNLRIRDAAARRLETKLLGDSELDEAFVIRAYEAADKIGRLDAGEATDRVEVSTVNRLLLGVYRVAGELVPAERRAELLERLDAETSGMLELEPGEPA